jgi:hypothetical protein
MPPLVRRLSAAWHRIFAGFHRMFTASRRISAASGFGWMWLDCSGLRYLLMANGVELSDYFITAKAAMWSNARGLRR